MVRPPLTPAERDRGRRLGALLREARGTRPPAEVAAASGISPEVLRKIESGRVPTPAFFTVAALARALGDWRVAEGLHDLELVLALGVGAGVLIRGHGGGLPGRTQIWVPDLALTPGDC